MRSHLNLVCSDADRWSTILFRTTVRISGTMLPGEWCAVDDALRGALGLCLWLCSSGGTLCRGKVQQRLEAQVREGRAVDDQRAGGVAFQPRSNGDRVGAKKNKKKSSNKAIVGVVTRTRSWNTAHSRH